MSELRRGSRMPTVLVRSRGYRYTRRTCAALRAGVLGSVNGIDVTYFTTSDSRFFVGTVALINSLRLTGHNGEVVVLDLGLSECQRRRLSTVATVQAPSVAPRAFPKALPDPARARGCIVLVDSDMLVVASLGHVVDAAASGRICLFHDPDDRWFEEWERELALKAPLRRQRYGNAGFLAFSAERWPWLLERWAEVNERVSEITTRRDPDPFRDTDQDALNALLMSEVPKDAVVIQPEWRQAHPDALPRVRIVNERDLACTDEGREVAILHHSLSPKTWGPRGWRRDARQAYIWLLPRVLFWDDVPLRLEHDEVPIWLRPTQLGRFTRRSLRAACSIPGLWFAVNLVGRRKNVSRRLKRRLRAFRATP